MGQLRHHMLPEYLTNYIVGLLFVVVIYLVIFLV